MQASVVTAVQTVNIKNDFVSNTEPSEGFKLVFREKIESPSPENNNINNESTTISSNKQADTSNKQNVENKVESAKPEDIVRNTKEPLKPKLTENIATEASIDNKVNEQVVSKLLMDLLLSKLYNPKGEKLTLQKISELKETAKKDDKTEMQIMQELLSQLTDIYSLVKKIDTKEITLDTKHIELLLSKLDKTINLLQGTDNKLNSSELKAIKEVLQNIKNDFIALKQETVNNPIANTKLETSTTPASSSTADNTSSKSDSSQKIEIKNSAVQEYTKANTTATLSNSEVITDNQTGSKEEKTSALTKILEVLNVKIEEVKETIITKREDASTSVITLLNNSKNNPAPSNLPTGLQPTPTTKAEGEVDNTLASAPATTDKIEIANNADTSTNHKGKESHQDFSDLATKDIPLTGKDLGTNSTQTDFKTIIKETSSATNTSDFIEKQTQIINQFKGLLALNKLKSGSEITLKLFPKDLGEIRINLVKEPSANSLNASIITAKFEVASDQVKSILESNFNLLKDALNQNSGLEIGSFSVNVGSDSQSNSFNELFDKLANQKVTAKELKVEELELESSQNKLFYHDNNTGSYSSVA